MISDYFTHGKFSVPTAALVERLLSPDPPPFALLRRHRPGDGGRPPVEVLIGEMGSVGTVGEIPQSPPAPGGGPYALALLPYHRLAERGLECHQDGTPLRVLRITEHHSLPTAELAAALPPTTLTLDDAGFETDDGQYAALVRDVVSTEVAREGLSVLIRRDYTARLRSHRPALALELFRRLLTAEAGAHWTFAVHTGGRRGRALVGATPQGHVRIERGRVVMNPMCGTYRYPPGGAELAGLLSFLQDPKESEELATTVDAELALLCRVTGQGVLVDGPRLRPMAHLLHSECRISGPAALSARQTLARTMFASTAVGRPFAEACRVVRRREPTGRGYYGGAIALLGHDAQGWEELDSAAVIRTFDIDGDGLLRLSVGATLGPGSSPEAETAETRAKAAALLSTLRPDAPRPAGPSRTPPDRDTAAALALDDRVAKELDLRRRQLSTFWSGFARPPARRRAADAVLLVDSGEEETEVLAHMVRGLGRTVEVRRYDEVEAAALPGPRGRVVLAPGPGRPGAPDTALRALARTLLAGAAAGGPAVSGIGTGFQVLARELGLAGAPVARPSQVVRRTVDVHGLRVTAAFSDACAVEPADHCDKAAGRLGIRLWHSADRRELVAFTGPRAAGYQFRPESVITTNGADLLRLLLA
ncbi:chorismate-binding protein [Streptomyces purpureus]|uniref:anthranilate synthase n=1 Tax=Streptomyces purpureus TaxID=1951 RepID=A0A918H1C9_9ACTN|nr:chorismate-binding protein [Streptomyces purpureus]GGT29115.1 phenazine-specific anthranilate synthase component I [Streptomyces purpureus]